MLFRPFLPMAALVAAACSSAFPSPGNAELGVLRTTDPGVRAADLEHGRALYLAKCGNCHLLIEPAKFDPGVWPTQVERMQREGRVHLGAADQRDIERYLVATSTLARR